MMTVSVSQVNLGRKGASPGESVPGCRRWLADALRGRSLRAVSAALAKRLSPADSEADYRGRIRRFRDGKVGLSAGTIFALGEALRDCGVRSSTGFGALWSEGLLGDYARAVMCLAQASPGWPHGWPPRDVAAMVGTHAPLYANPRLLNLSADAERLDEGLQFDRAYAERLDSDRCAFAEWIEKDTHGFGWFIETLPARWSDEADWSTEPASRKNRSTLPFDDLLVSAATLGDNKDISIDAREFSVWSQIFMWAIKAASAGLREGRIANLAHLWAALPRRLIEHEREAAVARARDQRTSDKPRRIKT